MQTIQESNKKLLKEIYQHCLLASSVDDVLYFVDEKLKELE